MIKRIALYLCISILCFSLQAQELMRTRTYSIHDGLPSNYISQISQDTQGVIWIATWNGVTSYDGYRFVNYRDNEGRFASNRIYLMQPGADGRVWILSYDKKPFVLDSHTGKYYDISEFTGFNDPARAFFTSGDVTWITGDKRAVRLYKSLTDEMCVDSVNVRVRQVKFDSDGCEWLYTGEGLKKYGSDINIRDTFIEFVELGDNIYQISKKGKIYSGHTPKVIASIPGVGGVTAFLPYGKNILLCATDNGVYAYHTAAKRIVRLDSDTAVLNAALHTDGSGRIWALTPDGSVAMAASASGTFKSVDFVDDSSGNTIFIGNLWIEDRYGTVWIAPKNRALGYFDETAGSLRNYPVRSRLLNNAIIPKVEVSYVDRQNNLWLSSTHNLTLVNFSNSNLKEVPLRENQATRSAALGPDGAIWLGANDGTIGRYDPDGRLLGYMALTPMSTAVTGHVPTAFSQKIYAMQADPKGNMWIGTKGSGLYRISKDGKVSAFNHDPNNPSSMPDDNIYDIDIDDRGAMWIATFGGGVAMLAPEELDAAVPQFVSHTNGLNLPDGDKYHKVRRITHTPHGVMIASCTSGLLTFSNKFKSAKDIKFYRSEHIPGDDSSLHSSHVMCALATSDGDVLVAPLGEKMQRIASENLLADGLKFAPLSDSQIHPFLDQSSRAGNVVSMVEGANGNVYVVLESCVVIYSPRTSTATSVGYNDFDRTIEFTEAKAVLDAGGRLWAPTATGAIVVDAEKAVPTDYVPDIVVTGIYSNGAGLTYSLNPNEIIVPAGEKSISLSFAALDYSNNELIQYAYRVDDAAAWTYIGNTNTINLGGLSAGKHKILIKSTNGDGVWADNVKEVEIYVTPTFWESVFGKIILLLMLVAVGVIIYVMVRMYRRHEQAKAEHRKMHDFIIGYVGDKSRSDDKSEASPRESESVSSAEDSDRKMLSRLTAYIEAHISNENLKVEDMAEAVGLGRTAFYNRLKTIVDMTPADFVRRLRMQRAQALIKEGNLSISEIAYAVGFSDPKYFTKCFKKETGYTPTDYLKSNPSTN